MESDYYNLDRYPYLPKLVAIQIIRNGNLNMKNIRNNSQILIFLTISCVLTGFSCRDDYEIRQYKTPKAVIQNKNKTSLVWEIPTGWIQKKAGSFRLASFEVLYKGQMADASIVLLSGSGGGILANINRWREQINLGKIDVNGLLLLEKRDNGTAGPFKWYRLVNTSNKQSAILGAVLNLKDKTVFVKLKGPLSVLDANQTTFLELCRSIKSGKS